MDVPERNLAKPLNRGNIVADKLNITSATMWACPGFKQVYMLKFQYDLLIHYSLLKKLLKETYS